MKLYRALWWNPVHSQTRITQTKWVVLRWPTPAMAQQAGMSTEAFEDFYFDVCTFDYAKLDPVIAPLKALMDRTDRVQSDRAGNRSDVQHQRHSDNSLHGPLQHP